MEDKPRAEVTEEAEHSTLSLSLAASYRPPAHADVPLSSNRSPASTLSDAADVANSSNWLLVPVDEPPDPAGIASDNNPQQETPAPAPADVAVGSNRLPEIPSGNADLAVDNNQRQETR